MQDVILVVEYSFLVCRPLFSSGKALNDKPHKDIIPFPINNWESTGEKIHGFKIF